MHGPSHRSDKRALGMAVAAVVVTIGAGTALAQQQSRWDVRTFDAPPPSADVVPLNSFADADPVFTTPPQGYSVETSTVPQVDLFENGGRGQFAFDHPFGPSYPNTDQDVHNDFTSRVTGTLVVTTPGTYDFFTDTDDGGRLRVDLNRNNVFDAPDEDVVPESGLQGAGTPEFGPAVNLTAGNYSYEFSMFERGGGASGEAGYRMGGAGSLIVIGDNAGGIGVQGPNSVRTVGPAPAPLVSLDNINEAEQNNATQPVAGRDFFSAINFVGEGGDGTIPNGVAFPGVSGDDFSLLATGVVDVINGTSMPDVTLGVNSDDGFRLRVNDQVVAEFVDPRGPDDTLTAPLTLNDGDVITLTFFERGGGDEVELFIEGPGGRILLGDPAGGILIVPEPASAAFMCLGGLGLLLRRRRRGA